MSDGESSYRKLVEGNPQPMWIFSMENFGILEVNHAAILKYGYSREEFLRLTIKDLRPSEEIEKFEYYLSGDQINTTGMNQSGPWRHCLKNGDIIDVEITSQCINWNGHNARVTTAWDVTKRLRMENSLRQAEEQYRSIFDNTREGIYQSTHEGKFITVNKSLVRMMGYDSAEELIASIDDIGNKFYADPGERSRVMDLLEKDGHVIGLESKVYTKDKKVIWIRDHIRAIKNNDGTIRYCEGTMEDITVRKETESKLRFHQEFSDMIMRAQTLFIGAQDPRHAFDVLLDDLLSITKSEYGFIGEVLYSADGSPYLKTHTITNIAWNEETRAFYNDNIEEGLVFANLKTLFGQVMVTGKPVIANDPSTDPRRGGLPEGHPPLNAFLGFPFGTGGKIEGMLGLSNRGGGYDDELIDFLNPFVSTISHLFKVAQSERLRQQTATALYNSENKLQAFFRSSRDASILLGMNAEILAFNPFANAFVVNSSGSELHEGDLFLPQVPSEMQASMSELITKALGGRVQQEEFLISSGLKGKKKWWLVSVMPAFDKNKQIFGVVANATNIDEIKKAELKLKKQFDELQKTNHELDRFVYSVSHDLRAPLASILGLINVAEIEPDKDSLNTYLEMMRGSVNRLDGFIKDILDYSRNSRTELKNDIIDFSVIISEVQKRLKPTPGAERLNVTIELNAEAVFCSDSTRFEIILNNLFSNAIKYQDFKKNVSYVSIKITTTSEKMTMLFIDNGIGIEQKHFDKIFTMFYRASDRAQGSGLGLYIARETVTKLGGTISIESTFGVSTSLEIILPNRDVIPGKE